MSVTKFQKIFACGKKLILLLCWKSARVNMHSPIYHRRRPRRCPIEQFETRNALSADQANHPLDDCGGVRKHGTSQGRLYLFAKSIGYDSSMATGLNILTQFTACITYPSEMKFDVADSALISISVQPPTRSMLLCHQQVPQL